MKNFMKRCPFCGGEASLYVCDAEGNIHDDDYENDPWSGLAFKIKHTTKDDPTGECPIATDEGDGVGMWHYDNRAEAESVWNNRADVNE